MQVNREKEELCFKKKKPFLADSMDDLAKQNISSDLESKNNLNEIKNSEIKTIVDPD